MAFTPHAGLAQGETPPHFLRLDINRPIIPIDVDPIVFFKTLSSPRAGMCVPVVDAIYKPAYSTFPMQPSRFLLWLLRS